MKFKVEPGIFKKFPGVRIGVLVVLGMNNTKGKKEIAKLLDSEQEKKQKKLAEVDLKEHPKIAPWREIYRKFGSKPRKYRSSVEALLRRVVADNKLASINPLVDLYNYISIKHLVPAGAEDLDKVRGDIVLGFAKGNEKGKLIGSDDISTCDQSEAVYKDDLGFICRRWNWREGNRTKITPKTKNIVVVLEAVPAVNDQEFQAAVKEAVDLIQKHLKGKVEIQVLDAEKRYFDIYFEPGKKLTPKEIKELEITEKKPSEKKISEIPFEIVGQKLFKVNRESFAYRLARLIHSVAIEIVGKRAVKLKEINWEHPANPEHGDYSTNLVMQVFGRQTKKIKKKTSSVALTEADIGKEISTPWDLANVIVNAWRTKGLPDFVAKIEVAQPGFINVWLKNEVLITQLQEVLKEKDKYGSSKVGKGRQILLEHTSPDPIKTIHVGHLRNNFLGMAIARVLKFQGFKVTKDCINNDRGTHVSRAMWGYLAFAKKRTLNKERMVKFKITKANIKKVAKKIDWRTQLNEWYDRKSKWLKPKDLNLKSDHFDLVVYSLGAQAEDLVDGVKEQVREILQEWEKKEKKIRALWKEIIRWSLEGYKVTYKRIGSVHDYVWHESRLYEVGKEIVYQGLKKGVFRKSEGAIVSDLAKYGLTDAVVIKSDGTSLYHTYDLNLTKQKRKKFPSDLYIWDIGNDQILYLKQLYAMCEQLGIGKRENYFHLNYGYVYLKGKGKMSSREGTVIKADEMVDLAHRKAKEIIEQSSPELRKIKSEREKENVAESVGLAALKYGLLRISRETDTYFDIEESLSLEGDSGPYLQYTYARCQSVLRKAEEKHFGGGAKAKFLSSEVEVLFSSEVNPEELALLRTIYQFPEVVQKAGKNFAPNLICNFLFDLAQKYNLFYNRHSILKAEGLELVRSRLVLTAAVAQVLKNGLNLLGIGTPERM